MPTVSELETEFGFPSEFPYEFDSFTVEHISSPVESVAGSTETESSDEEELFARLTRRLSQSSLHETLLNQLAVPINNSNKTKVQKEVQVLSESPLSPNMTAFSNDAWDAIYAAAEQVAKLKMNSELSKFDFQNRGVRSGFAPNFAAHNSATPLFTYHNLNRTHEIHQWKQEQMLKQHCGSLWGIDSNPTFSTYQQQQQKVKNKSYEYWNGNVKCTYPLGQPPWHHLQVNPHNQHAQPRQGYGSKSVLNGRSSVKKGCSGTGVFLPRQYAAPHEPRKKTMTAKVIPSVNSNMNDLNSVTQQRFANAYGADYNALLARNNAILMQQMLNLRREEATSYEMRLPQEWTY